MFKVAIVGKGSNFKDLFGDMLLKGKNKSQVDEHTKFEDILKEVIREEDKQ